MNALEEFVKVVTESLSSKEPHRLLVEEQDGALVAKIFGPNGDVMAQAPFEVLQGVLDGMGYPLPLMYQSPDPKMADLAAKIHSLTLEIRELKAAMYHIQVAQNCDCVCGCPDEEPEPEPEHRHTPAYYTLPIVPPHTVPVDIFPFPPMGGIAGRLPHAVPKPEPEPEPEPEPQQSGFASELRQRDYQAYRDYIRAVADRVINEPGGWMKVKERMDAETDAILDRMTMIFASANCPVNRSELRIALGLEPEPDLFYAAS